MLAMARMSSRTFGVLMSLEPAIGALSGFLFLQESLAPVQMAAVALIMAASAGVVLEPPRD
jgi:inner membrane transporter RhtA